MPTGLPILLEPAASDEVASIALKIPGAPAPLIVLLGDPAPALTPLLRSLLNRAIIPAAAASGARIVDNGENAGLAAIVGQSVRDAEVRPALIGIAPHPADVEPNHSVIVHLPEDWPEDPVRTILGFASVLVRNPTGNNKPVMVLLAGGGDAEKGVLVACARRQWPLLLIEQTGGLADEIVAAMKPAANEPVTPADPDIREIVETGDIGSFAISGKIDDLIRILLVRVDLRLDILADAWSRYNMLDKAAVARQGEFRRLQRFILGLGIAATFLAIVQSHGALTWLRPVFHAGLDPFHAAFLRVAHVLMVITPVAISVLVSINSRFREGNKWILLRAAAEAIKREIFRYRMQAGAYRDSQCGQMSREEKLAAALKKHQFEPRAERGQPDQFARSGCPEAAELLRFLNPDGYFAERIDNQIDHFVDRIARLAKQLKSFQIGTYVIGAAGTLLAAFRGDIWVALTTALAALLTTRLEMDQVENTLVQYNQALTGLRNVSSWWKALSQWEKARAANVDLLVDQTETTLGVELAGWVQQMQSALDKLTEKEQAQQKDKPNA